MSSNIVKVGRYDVDTYVDLEAFRTDVKLDGSDLNDNFLTQAGMMSYYGTLAARASGQAGRFKVYRDAVEAKIATAHRQAATKADQKITEAIITERVNKDPRVVEIREAYERAKEVEAELKAMAEGIRHRKDMIVQLGVSEREDAKGTARMKLSSGTEDRGQRIKKRLANKLA